MKVYLLLLWTKKEILSKNQQTNKQTPVQFLDQEESLKVLEST